jgi:hypothetical protein
MAAAKVAGVWLGCVVVGFAFTWLGTVHGCQLDEAGAHPCVVLGVDVGSPLSFLSVGLLLLASFGLPLFLLGILGCLGLALAQFLIHRFRTSRG